MNEAVTSGQRGTFWLPAAPDHQIAGQIEFRGPLAGLIKLDSAFLTSVTRAEPVIHGLLHDGKRVTALDCHLSRRGYVRRNDTQSQHTITAETFVVGEHFSDDPRFDSVVVQLLYLHDWANIQVGWKAAPNEGGDFSLRYTHPGDRTANLRDGRSIMLQTNAPIQCSERSVESNQVTSFRVGFKEPVALTDVANTVATLRDFISFAARRATRILEVRVTAPGVLRYRRGDVQVQEELELRSAPVIPDPPENTRDDDLAYWEFLFRAPETEEEFSNLLQRWVELEHTLGVMLDLFLGLSYAPPRYIENRFLNVCQAAEGYHRRTLDHKLMAEAEYRGLKKALTDACPSLHQHWLSGLLSHANEPSFKSRIQDVISKAGKVGVRLLEPMPRYPVKLRDYRNDYAHWLHSHAASDRVTIELADLCNITRILLEACILQDLGWTADEVAATIMGRTDFVKFRARLCG